MNHNSIAKTPQQTHILPTQEENFTTIAKHRQGGLALCLIVNVVNKIEYHCK